MVQLNAVNGAAYLTVDEGTWFALRPRILRVINMEG